MKNIIFELFTVAMTCFFSGCTVSNSGSHLESKAARMSTELIRSQVLRYKALLEDAETSEQMEKINEIFNALVPRNEPFTAESTSSISKALEEIPGINIWSARYQENLDNYHFFYKKLKERGGDMTGLDLETEGDVIDYEKYFSPPIKEPPNLHNESQTAEPA